MPRPKPASQPFPRTKPATLLRKLWHAIEQSVDPVAITNALGIIEYVNPGFENLTGYSKAQALGKPLSIFRSDTEPLGTLRTNVEDRPIGQHLSWGCDQ